MESRRMSTRSTRRSATLPVSPLKQAVLANVMQGTGKATAKRSTRKVLSDKTNATPGTGPATRKSVRKVAVVAKTKVEEPLTPRQCAAEPLLCTPAVVRGEDLLRSVVHSNLAFVQTPDGVARQNPEAETPQFGVPAVGSPQDYAREVAQSVGGLTPPQQDEVADARPPVETSPDTEVLPIAERLSSAWVGRDVDDAGTEVGEDDDSDCSVLVNVSSPGVSNMHLVASPAPTLPSTPQTADFKWQRRDAATKVKDQESESFKYYGGDDEYEGCEEFDEAGYGGEVVDCEDICQGIRRMGVADVGGRLPEHKGRHLRFNYNSDDEVDVEEVEVMRLRGLPTPMGKHLRFPEKDEVATQEA